MRVTVHRPSALRYVMTITPRFSLYTVRRTVLTSFPVRKGKECRLRCGCGPPAGARVGLGGSQHAAQEDLLDQLGVIRRGGGVIRVQVPLGRGFEDHARE